LDLARGTRKVAQKWRRKIFPAPDQEGMIPQKLLIDRPLRLEPAVGFDRRPADYKSAAMAVEICWLGGKFTKRSDTRGTGQLTFSSFVIFAAKVVRVFLRRHI
jgi:hypothetical protein